MEGAPQAMRQAGDAQAIFQACLVDGFGTKAPDGDKITISGGVATVEFSAGHTFEKHAVITIEGAAPASLNDDWRITAATSTTFMFDCSGIPDGTATGSIAVKRATPGHWEMPFSDETRSAFRSTHPDATGFFLRITTPADELRGVEVRGFESMTDIDTGLNPFPTELEEPEYAWTLAYYDDPTYLPKPWALIADEKAIYFFTKFGYSAPIGGVLRFFGDINRAKPGDFYTCGITAGYDQQYEPGRNTSEHFMNVTTGQFYLARTLSGAQPAPEQYGRFCAYYSNTLGGEADFPSPVNNGYVLLGPMLIRAGSQQVIRGTEPGLYFSETGDQGVNGRPGTVLEESFLILDGSDGLDRTMAAIVVADGDRDYERQCIAIDVEGPWR
jgi:hypothetical protein